LDDAAHEERRRGGTSSGHRIRIVAGAIGQSPGKIVVLDNDLGRAGVHARRAEGRHRKCRFAGQVVEKSKQQSHGLVPSEETAWAL
jgi:hypothetical protein